MDAEGRPRKNVGILLSLQRRTDMRGTWALTWMMCGFAGVALHFQTPLTELGGTMALLGLLGLAMGAIMDIS